MRVKLCQFFKIFTTRKVLSFNYFSYGNKFYLFIYSKSAMGLIYFKKSLKLIANILQNITSFIIILTMTEEKQRNHITSEKILVLSYFMETNQV